MTDFIWEYVFICCTFMLVLAPAYLILMQVNSLRPHYIMPESVESTANNSPFMAYLVYLISYTVVTLVWKYVGVLYAVVLLEIMSFVFMWLTHLETTEAVQVSSHMKESLLAYLIPSLLSYVCALIGLYLGGELSEATQKGYVPGAPYFLFMTIALTVKMGLFPFFVYTLNVSQGISWNAIFFIGITSKLPLVVVIVNYGHLIHPTVMIIAGMFSMLVSCLVIFNSVYMKRFIASSSFSTMGWISALAGLFKIFGFEGEKWYSTPAYMMLWLFFVTYSINTLLILIMLENCYPLFLSSYKGELDYSGSILGTWHHVLLRWFGVIGIISQMGLPPLAFFSVKYFVVRTVIELSIPVCPVLITIMVINSLVMFGAYIWLLWNVIRGKAIKLSKWLSEQNNTLEAESSTRRKIKLSAEYNELLLRFNRDIDLIEELYIINCEGITNEKVMASFKCSRHIVTGRKIWCVLVIALILVKLLVNVHSIKGSLMNGILPK